MDFYLNCWVPSLSGFYKIKELKNSQLIPLSKFILNQDHEGTSEYFEHILNENFVDKALKLTRFDKWFALCFLRAASMSPTLYLQTINNNNLPCNIEISLFEILSKLSENIQVIPFDFFFSNLHFTLIPSQALFAADPVTMSIAHFKFKEKIVSTSNEIKSLLSAFPNLRNYIAQQLVLKDNEIPHFIIQTNNQQLNLNNLQVRLFDNTLFFFLRSIFLPFCKGLYEKHYNLMKYVKINYRDLSNLTPSESDIYLNLYKQDETSKLQTNGVNIQ